MLDQITVNIENEKRNRGHSLKAFICCRRQKCAWWWCREPAMMMPLLAANHDISFWAGRGSGRTVESAPWHIKQRGGHANQARVPSESRPGPTAIFATSPERSSAEGTSVGRCQQHGALLVEQNTYKVPTIMHPASHYPHYFFCLGSSCAVITLCRVIKMQMSFLFLKNC